MQSSLSESSLPQAPSREAARPTGWKFFCSSSSLDRNAVYEERSFFEKHVCVGEQCFFGMNRRHRSMLWLDGCFGRVMMGLCVSAEKCVNDLCWKR